MLNSSRVSALEVFKNHSGVKQFSQETDDYKYRVIHSRTNKFQKPPKPLLSCTIEKAMLWNDFRYLLALIKH